MIFVCIVSTELNDDKVYADKLIYLEMYVDFRRREAEDFCISCICNEMFMNITLACISRSFQIKSLNK